MDDIISKYKQLKLSEAKELNQKMLAASGSERQKLREELFNGTLYLISNFIKNSGFNAIKSSSFDLDDIFSICCEEWLKVIDSGKIININTYAQILLSHTFYNAINSHLTLDKKLYSDNPLTCVGKFEYLLKNCLSIIDMGREVALEDIVDYCKNGYYLGTKIEELITNEDIEEFKQLINNIMSITNSKINSISLSKLGFLKYLLMELSYIDKSYNLNEYIMVDPYEELLDDMEASDIRTIMDEKSGLTGKEIFVLKERYGFYSEPKLLREIAKELKISRHTAFRLEHLSICKMRRPNSTIRKYYDK